MSEKTAAVDSAALPYRPCVGAVLIDPFGRVFAGQRIDNPGDAWQMPQGGIDPGETPREAAFRELSEEAGVGPATVELVRESGQWLHYDLPPELMGRIWGGQYRGQAQRWFAFRFHGSDADIEIETEEPEFRAWAWMRPEELVERIVPFKLHIYRAVFDEFGDLF
jgi:putative (di)nucleoside polyphosphate hydrolase